MQSFCTLAKFQAVPHHDLFTLAVGTSNITRRKDPPLQYEYVFAQGSRLDTQHLPSSRLRRYRIENEIIDFRLT
jgi:hypothetical protein